MEEEIIIPEEETFNYNKLRYILDKDGYVCHASLGGLIICDLGECTEYIGDVPEGYSTIEEWFEGEVDKLNAWKIVEGNLVFDKNKYNELEQIHKIEEEENSCASKKYVNDTLKKSTAVVTDELAIETSGNDLIILNNAGNYEIPELKVRSNTTQNVKVVSSNKNILGIDAITSKINGVNITVNTNGTIKLNGTANDYIEFNLNGSNTNKEMLFLIKNNIDYVISGLTDNVSLSLYSFDGTDRTLIGNYTNELINLSSSSKITQVTLNITSGAEFKNVVIAPQIEINNVATEFIKHEETKAYGILENNECIIENLVSYLDKTIIMIDNEVESSIQYYRYKYINEKLVEIQVQEDEIKSTVSEITETVDGQNQKISEVTQKVGELNSKITEIADITASKESFNGTIEIDGINQSEPIYVKVHPTEENISYLYPNTGLFPSTNLFPKVRTLRFTNTTTKEVVDYTLPTDLLYYDAENYDDFVLDYDMQSCLVNKKIGYNADGTTYVLEKPTTIEFEYPKIILNDGDYIITLLGYNNAYLFVRLMAQNIYTTQYATKIELDSKITQTVEEVDVSVNKKLEGYSTTEEMNSAINVKADSITSSVSRTYATKTELTTAKSEIKQTTDGISSEVSKKVGNNEIISKINQSAEAVQINANKISLNGKEINLTSENATIKSTNFNVDTQGNVTIGGTSGFPALTIKDSDATDIIEVVPNSINMEYYYPGANATVEQYLQKGGYYVVCNGTSTSVWYDGITTPTLTQTSKESKKKNIVKYSEKALDIVKDSEIYEYNFKSEDDKHKKHIGFVIGDEGGEYKTPEQVISNNREGIESYSMTSILWKAVQEQQQTIEQLQSEINELKGEKGNG